MRVSEKDIDTSFTKNWSFDTLWLHLVKRSIGKEYY
jgi:hypothetical protein